MESLVGERADDVYEERDLRCTHSAVQSIDRPPLRLQIHRVPARGTGAYRAECCFESWPGVVREMLTTE